MIRILFICLICFSSLSWGQHTIRGTFTPIEEFDWVLVYKVTPTFSNYVGDAELDEKGEFIFELDSTQSEGMYRLVYAVPEEEYNFDVIYNAKEDIAFTFNMDTGLEYQESVENKMMMSYTKSMALVSQSVGKFFREQSTDTTALLSIFNTQRETQKEFESISEGTIAGNFIRANRPYIPESFEDINTYIENIRQSYFDAVDFNNEVLQSSNFLVERCLNYVFGLVSGEGDEMDIYKMNVTEVAEAMKAANNQTKKMLLHILWDQFKEANYEELANFITDNFLLKVVEEMKDEELAKELVQYRNVALGKVAPNFEIQLSKNGKPYSTMLHDLELAENYILVFWSSSCSHCLDELPQLNDHMKNIDPKKYKVIAFGIEDETYRWKSETYNYPEFIHVIGLGKWENEVGNAYNVSSTPTYYILDAQKRIIGKPADFNVLKELVPIQK